MKALCEVLHARVKAKINDIGASTVHHEFREEEELCTRVVLSDGRLRVKYCTLISRPS